MDHFCGVCRVVSYYCQVNKRGKMQKHLAITKDGGKSLRLLVIAENKKFITCSIHKKPTRCMSYTFAQIPPLLGRENKIKGYIPVRKKGRIRITQPKLSYAY